MREALLVEALGEAARLIRQVEALVPALDESRRALQHADSGLRDSLAAFEGRMMAVTENAKAQTIRHMAVRADEAIRHTIDQQTQVMVDAARVAFGVELGGALQRLHAALQPLVERANRSGEKWLTGAAVAVAASAITWVMTIWMVAR